MPTRFETGRGGLREKKDVKGNEPKLDRKQRKTRGTNPIEPINEAIEESDKVSIMSKLGRFPGQSQAIDLESTDYGLCATGIGFVKAVFQSIMRPGIAPQNENGIIQLRGGDGGLTLSAEQDDKNCQERRTWGIQTILTPLGVSPAPLKGRKGPLWPPQTRK